MWPTMMPGDCITWDRLSYLVIPCFVTFIVYSAMHVTTAIQRWLRKVMLEMQAAERANKLKQFISIASHEVCIITLIPKYHICSRSIDTNPSSCPYWLLRVTRPYTAIRGANNVSRKHTEGILCYRPHNCQRSWCALISITRSPR